MSGSALDDGVVVESSLDENKSRAAEGGANL